MTVRSLTVSKFDPDPMAFPRNTTFEFDGGVMRFNLLEECSVSDHIASSMGFYEQPFLDALSGLLPDDGLVVDVGAHIGNHTIYFARVLGLRVIAFEPNPEAYSRLVANVEANEVGHLVECHNVALSDQQATLPMRKVHGTDAGSMAIVEPTPDDQDSEQVVGVEALPLDQFSAAISDCVYVKIDVEGHEPAVLRGAREVLSEWAPMLSTEIASMDHYRDIRAILGSDYSTVGLFNATPTALFRATPTIDQGLQDSLVEYGVSNALNYTKRRDWYVAQRSRAEILSKSLETERMFSNALAGTVRQLQQGGSGEPKTVVDPARLAQMLEAFSNVGGKRGLVVEFGVRQLFAAQLSIFVENIDLAHFDPSRLNLTRYRSGKEVKSMRYRTHSERLAGAAALISSWCEEDRERLGDVDFVMIVAPESGGRAAQEIVDLIDAPYVVIACDAGYDYSLLRFWVGASAVYLNSTGLQAEWGTSHPVPATPISLFDTEAVVSAVAAALEREERCGETRHKAHDEHRVLVVSYFAPPTTPVSVQRLGYWHHALPALAAELGRKLSVTWLTATRAASASEDMVIVPDKGEFRVCDDTWSFIEELRRLKLDRISASWSDHVEEFCRDWSVSFDTVILSGNPFYYFNLGPFFKDLWGARVILDFRDPFAWNPRFDYSLEQRALFMGLEREMVGASDAVISVNTECLNQISPSTSTVRRVVANGFNEDIVDGFVNNGRRPADPDHVRIVYIGTIFRNLSLDGVLDALPAGRITLDHYGRDYSISQAVKSHPSGMSHGALPYERLIAEIVSADAGVVMTSGEPSTQTTKLFDYIACDLDILIITSGELHSGNLHEMTAGLERVFWIKNTPFDLESFFANYTPSRVRRQRRASFSRRHQAEGLLDLIFELEGS